MFCAFAEIEEVGMADEVHDVVQGDGYAVANIDALGEGPGFRKVRSSLGVTAFGVNAIVLPPGYAPPEHYHEEQEETYFVHSGKLQFEFGDGSRFVLGPGGVARVSAGTLRTTRNVGEEDATYICFGGKDGYVGRDGIRPGGEF